MRGFLLSFFILGSVPFILAYPHLGILFWSWIAYMNPHQATWGIAQLPFAAIVAVATMIGWLLSKERQLPFSSIITVLLILWMAWITLTTVTATFPETAQPEWNRAIKIMFMAWLTTVIMQSRERINALVWVIALSIGFYGLKGGIFTILTGGENRVYGPDNSFMSDANSLALGLGVTIPLMWYLYLRVTSKWFRIAMLGVVFFSATSMLFSYSRGAFIQMLAVVLFLGIKFKKKFLLGIVVIAGALSIFYLAPEQWFDRMETIQTYEEDGSVNQRFKAWRFAWETGMENPILGGGFSIFRLNTYAVGEYLDGDYYHNAHSIYFEVLAAHGVVGLLLFLSLGISAYRAASWTIAQARGDPELEWARDLSLMLQVSLISFAVGGAFQNLAFSDLPYHIIALAALVQREVALTIKGKQVAAPDLSPISTPGPQ